MDPHALQLGYYLRTLWSGRLYILLATVVALAAGVVYALQSPAPPPVYTATATILVQEASADGPGGAAPAKGGADKTSILTSPSEETINPQISLGTSRSVLEGAMRRLQAPGEDPTPQVQAARMEALRLAIKAEVITKTNLIKITASAPNPRIAELRANAVADSYIEYANVERIRSIHEAIAKITSELQGIGTLSDGNKQALAAMPRISLELANIRTAVLASTQGLQALQSQTHSGSVNAVRLELPLMERSARTLDSVSKDLKKMYDNLKGRQRQGADDVTQTLTAQGVGLEQTGSTLNRISKDIQSILAQINKLDAFVTAARDADYAATSLSLVRPKTTEIQTADFTDARKLSAIGDYTESMKVDLTFIATTLRQAASAGSGLTESQRNPMRSQGTSYNVGLLATADDLSKLRGAQTDNREYGQILLVEGYVGSALKQLTDLTKELENLDQLATMQKELVKAQSSIEESRVALLNAATSL